MFSTNSKKDNEIVLIVGKKGTGKTTLLKSYILTYSLDNREKIIIDPLKQIGNVDDFITLTIDEEEQILKILEKLYNRGDVVLFIDEIDLYSTSTDYQKSIIRKLFRYARNKGISVIATAKRIANVNKDIISNCDKIHVFQTVEQNDLKRLKEVYYLDVKDVQTLKKFEYLTIDLNNFQLEKERLKDYTINIIFNER